MVHFYHFTAFVGTLRYLHGTPWGQQVKCLWIWLLDLLDPKLVAVVNIWKLFTDGRCLEITYTTRIENETP